MSRYDRAFIRLMEKWALPGGALALVKDGQVLLSRGYGYADLETGEWVQPTSRFRIASLSKPITAVAVLKLAEEGALSLDTPAFQLLNDLQPPGGEDVDPRIQTITIRQLLQHAGGWNSERSFDPMFMTREIAQEMETASPADCATIIRYMLGQPLDFDPGSQYAYSNFGYCILGRVIEKVSGLTYEAYVRSQVLEPAGIEGMYLGHSLLQDKYPDEVHYYEDWAGLTQSVFSESGELISWPYGGFSLEAMDAHGGWVASAIDLARFAAALEGSGPNAILTPTSLVLMTSRPESPLWEGASSYYAFGWRVRPAGKSANWWHTGSLPGTSAVLYRTADGLVWAALFNARPNTPGDEFLVDVITTMGQAAMVDKILWSSLIAALVLVGLGITLFVRRRRKESTLKKRNSI